MNLTWRDCKRWCAQTRRRYKKVYGESRFVLATSDRDSTWGVGDKIRIGDEELEIAGLLGYDPFSDDGLIHGKVTLIASGETFVRLTGITDYSLVMLKMSETATDDDVKTIQDVVGSDYRFNDRLDEQTAGTYMAFVACVYAFLAIISLVTVLNIVNSISMSVSARVKQYGSMRAVGMDESQVTK